MPKEKAKNFANKIGAFFRETSAKESIGIDELFICLGNKFIDPNFIDDEKIIPKTNLLKIIEKERSGSKHRKDSIKLDKSKMRNKKKNCC